MRRSSPGVVRTALAGTSATPYWLDDPGRPDPVPPLDGDTTADLVVVGGGYLGLWTALLAKERDPAREVVLVEAATCGRAASGRNGGFCEASLTHGFTNGMARWPEEMPELLAMGRDNLAAIEDTVRRHDIDCDFQRNGSLAIANAPHQVDGLREMYDGMRRLGQEATWLSADAVRARIDSPTFLAGVHDPDGAIVEPARLAWGLRRACLDAGVRIHEHTRATALAKRGGRRLGADRGGTGECRTRRARHERVPAAAPPTPADDRPGLRLRADE